MRYKLSKIPGERLALTEHHTGSALRTHMAKSQRNCEIYKLQSTAKYRIFIERDDVSTRRIHSFQPPTRVIFL